MNLEGRIEAVLFSRGGSLKIAELAQILESDMESVRAALRGLYQSLESRGVTLLEHDDTVMMGTSPDCSDDIRKALAIDLTGELTKAALETLTLVAYRGPLAKSEIDFIRGVNSHFILRNLMVRGLIDRIESPTNKRAYFYQVTLELLAHLGISRVEDLPEYESYRRELEESLGHSPLGHSPTGEAPRAYNRT